jgi:hypothetical protein
MPNKFDALIDLKCLPGEIGPQIPEIYTSLPGPAGIDKNR